MVLSRTLLALIALRLLVALTSTSTIHPDEHFQNPEIAASLVFDYGAYGEGPLRTWEWIGEEPCRSLAPVWASVGGAFQLLKLGGSALDPSARALFFAQRALMFLLSLSIDWMIWITSKSEISNLLFATSPVTFTFLLRPFSNSFETLIFAIALSLVGKILDTPGETISKTWTTVLGSVLAVGIFTRITFLAFAVPLIGAVGIGALQRGRASSWPRVISSLVRQAIPALLGFSLTATTLALFDTLLFSSLQRHPFLLWTPLNLFLFNLSPTNLAEHGIHPRYLHAVVNWPMLFGVGVWGLWTILSRKLSQLQRGGLKEQGAGLENLYLAALLIPTAILSIQPHQEPRFLLPLLVPLVLILKDASFFKTGTNKARRLRRIFWALWLGHGVVFVALFGYLHQGGLVPALLAINSQLQKSNGSFFETTIEPGTTMELIFWKTFMPPRHLLIPVGGKDAIASFQIRVIDLSGAPPSTLYSTLANLSRPGVTTVVVAPAWAFDSLDWDPSERAVVDHLKSSTIGMHLDMDSLGEFRWSRAGMGIWEIR